MSSIWNFATDFLAVIGLVTVVLAVLRIVVGPVPIRGGKLSPASWPADLIRAAAHPPVPHPAQHPGQAVPAPATAYPAASPAIVDLTQAPPAPAPRATAPPPPLPPLTDMPVRREPLPDFAPQADALGEPRESASAKAGDTPADPQGDLEHHRPAAVIRRPRLDQLGWAWRDGVPIEPAGLFGAHNLMALIRPHGIRQQRVGDDLVQDLVLSVANALAGVPQDVTISAVQHAMSLTQRLLDRFPRTAGDGSPASLEVVALVPGESGLHLVGGHFGSGGAWIVRDGRVLPAFGGTGSVPRMDWERSLAPGDRVLLADRAPGIPTEYLLAGTAAANIARAVSEYPAALKDGLTIAVADVVEGTPVDVPCP
jgi:hypothetical protein